VSDVEAEVFLPVICIPDQTRFLRRIPGRSASLRMVHRPRSYQELGNPTFDQKSTHDYRSCKAVFDIRSLWRFGSPKRRQVHLAEPQAESAIPDKALGRNAKIVSPQSPDDHIRPMQPYLSACFRSRCTALTDQWHARTYLES
jgi:hypothetical protein